MLEKNFNETIFFQHTNLSWGKFNYTKRWRIPCYFKKNFLIGYLKELFKKLWTKIQKIFKFFNHLFALNFSYFTNHTTYVPNFFYQNNCIEFATCWRKVDISIIFSSGIEILWKLLHIFWKYKIQMLVVLPLPFIR